MAKATIRNGSRGSAVTEWQNYLKSQGYNIEADGIFGPKTLEATKQYQQKNGLTVDGIVGSNTWGSMNTSANTNKNNTTTTNNTTFNPSDTTKNYQNTVTQKEKEKNNLGTFTYDDYVASDSVNAAWSKLDELEKPGEFQYGNQQLFDEVFDKIMNGEEFSYDLNGDALYQQYKDQYVNQGKLAMQDAIGQASAMTGGYGNSYAQSVGQQTYQGYLQQLNDKIPELYKLALDKYNMDRQDLKDQYSMLSSDRNYQYGMHRDDVSDYYTDRDYYTGQAQWQSDFDWNKYITEQEQNFNEYNTKYNHIQDDLDRADENYWNSYGMDYTQFTDDRAYDYQVERDAIEDNQWQQEFNLSKKNSSSGGSDKDGSGKGYDNGTYEDSVVKQAQEFIGVSADGKWGDDSAAKAKEKGYNSLEEVVAAMGNDGGINNEYTADDFTDFSVEDWMSFFTQICNESGVEASQNLFTELTSQGLIPKNMQYYAGIGARMNLRHQ